MSTPISNLIPSNPVLSYVLKRWLIDDTYLDKYAPKSSDEIFKKTIDELQLNPGSFEFDTKDIYEALDSLIFDDKGAIGNYKTQINKLNDDLKDEKNTTPTVDMVRLHKEIINTLQSNLPDINTLDDQKQKTQLLELNKKLKIQHDAFNAAFDRELRQQIILRQIVEDNEVMKNAIRELCLIKGVPAAEVQVASDQTLLKNIRLNDVDTVKLPKGYAITKETNGTYSIQYPFKFMGLFYHMGGHNQAKQADYNVMAALVRANGSPAIVMKVDGYADEDGLENARMAYQACREAGYQDDEITIKINGEVKKTNELFSGFSSRLETINKRSHDNQAATEKHTADMGYHKDTLANLRASYNFPEPEEPHPVSIKNS